MRRFLTLALTFLLLAALLTPAGYAAVEPLTPSEEVVELLKRLEGFREYAYQYNGKWYIGYGSACEENTYPNGISEAEAEGMLRERLETSAGIVNAFLLKYNIVLEQHQFDALCSFTYNLGSQWIDPDNRLCAYLIRGVRHYSQDELVSAIATWCYINGAPHPGIINRRMAEACLFVTGNYTETFAGQYVYLRHDAAGGDVSYSLVFYPLGQPYGSLQVPRNGDRSFLGWFTESGEAVSSQTVASENRSVYARWTEEGEEVLWENPYRDLTEDHWCYTYVRDLSMLHIIEGYEDGTFQPERFLSAGEALKLTLLAAGHPDQSADQGEHWAGGYLRYAVEREWLTEGEVPDLDVPVSRALVAKLAAQALNLPENTALSPFSDTEDPYILALAAAGIVEGDTNEDGLALFRPEDSIRRSHICAIVWRMERREVPVEPLSPEELGYIPFGEHQVPLLTNMPKCSRDSTLFVQDDRRHISYGDPSVYISQGIDVSAYQGDVDWRAVRADGIEFVFLRLAYRGYTQGTLNLDSRFLQNLEGAKAAGLKVGAYVFSTAISPQEGMEEALFALETLKGQGLELPIVFDWEVNNNRYRNYNLDTDTLNATAAAFCETVKAAGYQPMIYFNLTTGYLKYDLSRLQQYDFWLAQYIREPTMYYDYQVWQYSDSGSVQGIDGKVDMNVSFKRY